MEKYNSYSFSDFLDDDSFVSFIKNGQEEQKIWQQWLDTLPPNLETYYNARNYLLTILSANEVADTAGSQDEVWGRIQQSILQKERHQARVRSLRLWSTSAAAALLLLFTGLWYYRSQITITTGSGQQLTVTLPDQSVVQLNANSSLTYYRAWAWHAAREVWLNGEGFFRVTHLNHKPDQVKMGEQFFAHAGDVRVQVLGTEFNVKNRRSQVMVSLISGKISVQSKFRGSRQLIINPGNAVEYSHGELRQLPIKSMKNKPLAWTTHKMIVSGMTVSDIIENYEDTYGGHIILDNPLLNSKRIDGTISLLNREGTLYMLANLLNATVEQRDGDTYYLKSNHTK
jgi:ferric-dicitrate binding protein FerR (iron transport regulator)